MKFNPRLIALPLAAVVLLATACTEGDTIIQSGGEQQTGINSAGVGKVVGAPDTVLLQLGVDVERPAVEAAREQAANSMQLAIASLKANGVEDKDIRTVQFSVQPQYDFASGNRQTLRGYRVSNVVNVKVRKVDTASKIIDDATKASGNDAVVRSINFTIDDPSKLQSQARDLAVKQARERAEQLANPAGVKLGRVLSISEGGSSPVPPQPFAAVAAPRTGDTSTPIQTGELEVVVNVNVVFAIED